MIDNGNQRYRKLKPRRKRLDADAARLAAARYCLFHYPTLYTGWNPRLATSPAGERWLVSIVLTDPDYGVVGEVGELTLDTQSGEVTSSTPAQKVIAAGERLYKLKHDALKAASRSSAKKS